MSKEIEHLPAITERTFRHIFSHPPPTIEPEEGAIPLSHYFWIIRRQSWKIALFVATCLVATLLSRRGCSRFTNQLRLSASIAMPRAELWETKPRSRVADHRMRINILRRR